MEPLFEVWDYVVTVSRNGEYEALIKVKMDKGMTIVNTNVVVSRGGSRHAVWVILQGVTEALGANLVLSEWADVGETPPPDGEMPF